MLNKQVAPAPVTILVSNWTKLENRPLTLATKLSILFWSKPPSRKDPTPFQFLSLRRTIQHVKASTKF